MRTHAPTPYKPFPLFGLGQEMENLFQRFFCGSPTGFFGTPTFPYAQGYVPYAQGYSAPQFWGFEVIEQAKEYLIRAELPGFEPRELDVELNENFLSIKAEKEETNEGYGYCNFYRTLSLPFTVEPSKVKAVYHHGILLVHIPKPEELKGKHIPIKAE
jgi:HSP20 family protein